MNRILLANLDEFSSQYSFDSVSEADKYEYLSGYCFLAKYRPNATVTKNDILGINVGQGNDWGIDNIIILVNDCLVTDVSEINELIRSNASIRVKIVLIQAKTSASINVSELNTFLKGCRDMLAYLANDRENLPTANEKLQEKLDILDIIYANGNLFDTDGQFGKPRLHLYYVIGGENNDNKDATSSIADNERSVKNFNLVADLKCEIVTANEICSIYQNTRRNTTCELEIQFNMNMPRVERITESHLCLIPFSEFKKIIIDEEGNLIKSVFEDNVRDFQGDNPVNKAMANSIKSGKIELFTAMNNGLTIITRKLTATGTKFVLEDYQIVNGCQTCHVLYENRNIKNIDNLVLMVKIISSEDREIRDSIIVANNNQTEVKREQLTSLLKSQRIIENYYKAQTRFTKLYYERRSKQYSYGREKIPASNVITIPFQIRAYVSMVMGEPHLTSNYYGQIIEKFNGKNDSRKIFDPKTSPAFYYMSALAALCRDQWLANGKIDKIYRHVKHHLLYAITLLLDRKMPELNSNKAEDYCEYVCAILSDEKKGIELFQKAGELINQTLGRMPEHNDLNDPTLAKRIRTQYGKNKYLLNNNTVTTDTNNSTNQKDDNVLADKQKDTESKKPKVVGVIDLSKIQPSRPVRPKKRRRK